MFKEKILKGGNGVEADKHPSVDLLVSFISGRGGNGGECRG
jgi:hypothetical protein